MMKFYLSICIVLFWAGASFAQEGIPSKIKDVTLFSNQAMIKREVTAKVNKGLNEINLEIKTFNVDKNAITAKVFGDGEILSVQYAETYIKESPRPKIKELELQIEELEKSKRKLLDERETLKKKETFLNSVIDFAKTKVPEDMKTSFPSTESLEETLGFLGTNLQKINEDRQSIDFKVSEIEKDIRVLREELSALQRRPQNVKKFIEVVFNSSREQTVDIEASYLAYNAFWTPFYKVDVPMSLEEVDLVMFSKIKQQTGEDWKNVSLSVSNVIPLRGVGLPDATSWYLDIMRPPVIQGVMEREKVKRFYSEKEEMSDVASEMKAKPEATFAVAQAKELPLSFEYQLPRALDIESRDKETLLPIFSKSLKGEFFYYAVPKVSTMTFLVCKASADKELLGGQLNVHFGGRYIGKTILGEKKAGEEFNISLGADREIKTKREKIEDKRDEKAFGGRERKKVIRDLAFKTTVENVKDKSVKIKILDSIPVSKTDKIVVKDLKITPEPTEKDYQDREGVLLWEFELDPKEKKEILIEFTVTYPKDSPPQGL